MHEIAMELIKAGIVGVIASLLTLRLSNKHAQEMALQASTSQLSLARQAAADALTLEASKALTTASEHRYEDRRDALLAFQDEVATAMGDLAVVEKEAAELPEGQTVTKTLDLRPVSRALYRAMAFSSAETAEAAKNLHTALTERAVEGDLPFYGYQLGKAFDKWTAAARIELEPSSPHNTSSSENYVGPG